MICLMIHGVELMMKAKDMVATDLVTASSTFTFICFFFSFLCGADARNRVSLVITIIIISRLRTLQYPSVQ